MGENARAIFDAAYETLDRTSGIAAEVRSDPLREDALESWSRGMQRAQPKPSPSPRSATLTDAEVERLRAEFDDKIRLALAPVIDAIGGVIGAERVKWKAQIEALSLRIDALTAEMTKNQTTDSDGVVELPGPFIRRTRAA